MTDLSASPSSGKSCYFLGGRFSSLFLKVGWFDFIPTANLPYRSLHSTLVAALILLFSPISVQQPLYWLLQHVLAAAVLPTSFCFCSPPLLWLRFGPPAPCTPRTLWFGWVLVGSLSFLKQFSLFSAIWFCFHQSTNPVDVLVLVWLFTPLFGWLHSCCSLLPGARAAGSEAPRGCWGHRSVGVLKFGLEFTFFVNV